MDNPGNFLRRRVRANKLNQAELGAKINKSQSWVSNILLQRPVETLRRMWSKEPELLEKLQDTLSISDAELAELLDLDESLLGRSGTVAGLTVRLPVYGTVAAGINGDDGGGEVESFMRFAPEELPSGVADSDRLFIVRVNGDSMYEDNLPRPVPDGAVLIIERGVAPSQGDLVVAYVPELDIGVVKQFTGTDLVAFLRSYRPGGPAFWASDNDDRIHISGVVRRISYEP